MPGHSRWRVAGTATLFIAPSLIPLLAFTVGPMLASLGISFTNWSLLAPAHWVGVDNYRALWSDGEFRASLGHTLLFIAGYLPLVLLGGLGVALALNQRIRGLALFRTVYFLPVVTSWVVVALIWKWLLNPQTGVVDYLLGLVGITGPGWWVDPHWAMPSIILASAWKDLGFVMIILLAGLQAIPDDYYEAASLDGAGAIARFRHITLPLLSPALFFVVVISLINNFQVFDQVWVMTQGGPAGSTSVVMERIVKNAFSFGRMGYAAAMSWVLFAIILMFTLAQFRLQRRWVHYE
ncbi:MAG: sugar ABC transporter permease [Actinobacteria bacterium]|nr:MAG: sugar ABC transporter permease [Actinomycetota bacterium]